jgi:two-component system response regulator QseB
VVAIRVILIEQHQMLARPLKQGLEEEGFSVVVVRDGEQGNLALPDSNHDVIILDPRRPGDNGLALLRDWRRNGLRSPVLVLSCPNILAPELPGADIGPVDFLCKPFVLNELFSRLRALSGCSL